MKLYPPIKRMPSTLLSIAVLVIAVATPVFADGVDRLFHFDNDWVLKINLKDFKLQKNDYSYEKSFRNVYGFNADGLIVSVFIEPAAAEGDSKVARQYYTDRLKQSPVLRTAEKSSEKGPAAMYEYFVAKFQDQEINQRHVNMYLVRDNLWIDIHISKVRYKEEDKALFDAIINSVSFAPKNAYDYFGAGSYMYQDKKYAEAARYYTAALDIEARKRTLEDEVWFALIDHLGISLVLSGDAAKAKEVFLFGIKKSPEYPLFYYNLACTFAEEGDAAGAAKYLKQAKAVAKKKKFKLPDIKKDNSFDKVRDTKEFRQVADQD